MIKKMLLAMMILSFANEAMALVDLRLTYGLHTIGKSDDLGTGDSPKVVPLTGLGADVIFSPPLFPLGFGLRYEQMGAKFTGGDYSLDNAITRTAAIVNFRIIDTLIMVGPIFTWGLTHSTSVKFKDSSTAYNLKSTNATSYTAGLEAGLKVPFLVGGEIGYMNMKINDLESSGISEDTTYAGAYTKLFVGMNF